MRLIEFKRQIDRLENTSSQIDSKQTYLYRLSKHQISDTALTTGVKHSNKPTTGRLDVTFVHKTGL